MHRVANWTATLLAVAVLVLVTLAIESASPSGPATVAAQSGSGSSAGLPAGLKDPPLLSRAGARKHAEAAVVRFISPAEATVAARRPAQIDLHFEVAQGLHINSHAPHEKTLIPTRLAVAEKRGLEVTAVDFPPGADYTLAFSPKEKLSVYTGDLILHVHLTAQPGEHLLEGALRYQACDMTSCMPPKSLPFSIGVTGK